MLSFKSKKAKYQLKQVIYITIAWLIISNLQFSYEYTILSYYGSFPIEYNPLSLFIANLISVTLAGVIGGTMVVTFMTYWVRNKPYGLALLYILGTFTFIFFFVSIVGGSITQSSSLGKSVLSQDVLQDVFSYLMGADHIKNYTFWLFVVLGTIVVMLVNDKYGPGVFRDFLLGKYFKPKKEERIFMFLDIRSSTSIAEKLGEEKYFNFLKDFFKDATPGVLYSDGEIYQYVGDEMVVSWRTQDEKEQSKCVDCFFEIKSRINKRSEYYIEKYGIIPEIKAGLHYGLVVAGEIGLVKRDIVFSGDVLNTASRIQSQCNIMGVDILLSKKLIDKLVLPPSNYQPSKIGDIELKGKEQKVVLYTI